MCVAECMYVYVYAMPKCQKRASSGGCNGPVCLGKEHVLSANSLMCLPISPAALSPFFLFYLLVCLFFETDSLLAVVELAL